MTRRVPLVPTLVVAAAVAAMIALGVWQWNKRAWKADLIARHTRAQSMNADVPWPRDQASMERSLFRWSQFTCKRVISIRSGAGTSIRGQSGWRHIARCAIDGGGEADVALGWSNDPRLLQWGGGTVAGTIGPGGTFGGVLYAAHPPAGLEPLKAPDPNNEATSPSGHLAYAIQWFLFALTAVIIYTIALRKRWREC